MGKAVTKRGKLGAQSLKIRAKAMGTHFRAHCSSAQSERTTGVLLTHPSPLFCCWQPQGTTGGLDQKTVFDETCADCYRAKQTF